MILGPDGKPYGWPTAGQETFDQHRPQCPEHCNKSPYTLCDAGYELLRAEVAADRVDYNAGFRPWSTKQLAVLVGAKLRQPCHVCGGAIVKRDAPALGFDLVCSVGGADHSCFPVDTGPFSLGRRVD